MSRLDPSTGIVAPDPVLRRTGGLFDGGPSALYGALAKLLGLEVLADAEKLLVAQLKSTKVARGLADDASLKEVPALRALADLESPNLDEIESVAARLRTAGQALADAAAGLADSTRHRIDLLQAALRFHDHAGDTECRVCGQGALDGAWAAQTRTAITDSEAAMSEYRSAETELANAGSTATGLLVGLRTVDQVADLDVPDLAAYKEAFNAAQRAPADDTELVAHFESALVSVAAAADLVRVQADAALSVRESSWAPLAAQLGGWVPMEQSARKLDGTVKTMTAARKWITDHAVPSETCGWNRLPHMPAPSGRSCGTRRYHVGRICHPSPRQPRRQRRRSTHQSIDGDEPG